MLKWFLLPVSHSWLLGLLWAILACLPALFLAHRKNRSQAGWGLLCGFTGLFLGVLGFGWVILLFTCTRLSMRMKYLTLKFEEQIADAMKLPSPIGGDLEKRILMVLAYNPQGLRIGALAQGIGQNWRHIEEIVHQLLSEGKLRKEGDRFFFNLD